MRVERAPLGQRWPFSFVRRRLAEDKKKRTMMRHVVVQCKHRSSETVNGKLCLIGHPTAFVGCTIP